jgi:hypothetical protein
MNDLALNQLAHARLAELHHEAVEIRRAREARRRPTVARAVELIGRQYSRAYPTTGVRRTSGPGAARG